MDLGAIETGLLDSNARRLRVPLNILSDLRDGQCPRGIAASDGYRRWGDKVESGVDSLQRGRRPSASESPQLDVDEGAFGVDAIGNLC